MFRFLFLLCGAQVALFMTFPVDATPSVQCGNGQSLLIGAETYLVQNADRPHSCDADFAEDSAKWLFEVRAGDRWPSDIYAVERSEVSGRKWRKSDAIANSYAISLGSFESSADWLVIGQWHGGDNDGRSPYIAWELDGNDLVLLVRHTDPKGARGQSSARELYRLADAERDEWHQIRIEHRVGETDGFMRAWLGETQVADYSGPLGYWDHGDGGYWKFGIYRPESLETAKVSYRDVVVELL